MSKNYQSSLYIRCASDGEAGINSLTTFSFENEAFIINIFSRAVIFRPDVGTE